MESAPQPTITPRSVVVLGAGLSGLACAWQLGRHGWRVTLLEKSDRVGGAVGTIREAGYAVEAGPNTLQLNSQQTAGLLADLGLDGRMVEANREASQRFIVRRGRPVALPRSPLGFLTTPWMSAGAKWRLLAEPFASRAEPDADESLANLVRRRMGQEWLDYAINPMVAGIFAGDPEALGVRWAFPKLWRLEQEYGSFLWGGLRKAVMRHRPDPDKLRANLISFPDGLGELAAALARELHGAISTGTEIHSIERVEGAWTVRYSAPESGHAELAADTVVCAVPAYNVDALDLPGSFAPLVEKLGAVAHPPVVSVALGYRRDAIAHPLDGFGMLAPAVERRQILGTLFSSSLYAGRAPDGKALLTTYVGGSRQPELAALSDADLYDTVHRELTDLLGITAAPEFRHIVRWPHAIPQYRIGHGDLLADLDRHEATNPGWYWAGNYRTGISLPQCLNGAVNLAERIRRESAAPAETSATLLSHHA